MRRDNGRAALSCTQQGRVKGVGLTALSRFRPGRMHLRGPALLCTLAIAALLTAPGAALAAVRRPAATPRPTAPSSVPAATLSSVRSGDMADILAWPAAPAGVTAIRVQRASAAAGPWSTVVRLRADARGATLPVKTPARAFYRVLFEGAGAAVGAPSRALANDVVDMARTISQRGGAIRSSNGDVAITVPAGALSAPTRIGVTESAAGELDGAVPVTSRFTFTPDGATFAVPVQVRLRYAVPVRQFQVASGIERVIELCSYDAASGTWVPVPTTLDTASDVLTAAIGHFSEWEGAAIQPHGTSGDKTGYCSGICHDLVEAPGSSTLIAPSDPAVCYNCHGGTDPLLGPDHATGSNIQAAFFACPGQVFDSASAARHPVGVGAGKINCTACHDPHAGPAIAPKLLRAAGYYDPVTRRYAPIASKNATMPGSEFCWACHGVKANAAIQIKVPGYWTRAGGDRQTGYATTPHARATGEGGRGCMACHGGHGAPNTGLLTIKVGGVPVTGNACYACHEGGSGLWSGKGIFEGVAHAFSADTTHALPVWPGLSNEPGACRNCHDVHSSAPGYLRASGDQLCFTCHDDASVQRPGDAGYRGRTAFTASAHATATCGGCHAVHGASADATTQPFALRAAQQDACFRCHAVDGEATTGTRPNTWNGRDIKVEFQRPSRHPVTSGVPALTASPDTQTVFTQSTPAEFSLSTMSYVNNISWDGPELYWGTVPMASRANQRMAFFSYNTGTQQYDTDVNGGAVSWNDDGYDPPNLPAGKQVLASSRADGRIVVLARGAAFHEIWELTLPSVAETGTWTLAATLPTTGGSLDNPVGADVAYDPAAKAIYVIPGSGSSALFRWNVEARTLDTLSIVDGAGAPIALGQGSCLAFSELPDALWFIRSESAASTDQGYLYRAMDPSAATTSVTGANTGAYVGKWFTAGTSRTSKMLASPYGAAVFNNYKMTRYRKAGADYLYIFGSDFNHADMPSQYTVSDLTNPTPTRSGESHTYPWTTAANPQTGFYIKGGDLEWDGGDFIYCTNAETVPYYDFEWSVTLPTLFKRANITAGTGWEPLTPAAGTNGGSLGFGTATPPANAMGTGYRASGTVTSPEIAAPADTVSWGTLTLSSTAPSGTAVSVKVRGHNGTDWVDLPGLGNVTSQADLTGVSATTYKKLQLVATLATADQATLTPRLGSWSLTAATKGRLYTAGSADSISTDWLGVRPMPGPDTYQSFTGAPVNPTTATITVPRAKRPAMFFAGIWAGSTVTTTATYLEPTNLWNDPTAAIQASPNWPATGPFANGAYNLSQFWMNDTFWVFRSTSGWPAYAALRPGLDTTWTVYPGSGMLMNDCGGFAIPSKNEIWVSSSNQSGFLRFNTVTRTFDRSTGIGRPAEWPAPPGSYYATYGAYNTVYSAQQDKLYLVDRGWSSSENTQTGTGHLLVVDNAYAKMLTGSTILATDTYEQWSPEQSGYPWGALHLVTVKHKEYLLYFYRDSYSHTWLKVTGPLDAPVTSTFEVSGPPSNKLIYDGERSFYSYGTDWTRTMSKLSIPDTPTAGGAWSGWTSLANSPGDWTFPKVGAAIEVTAGPFNVTGYSDVTTTTPQILPGDTDEWGWLTWTANEPAWTDVRMTVEGWNGSAWQAVPGFVDLASSPVDLGSLRVGTWPKLRVKAVLSTRDWRVAPSISAWSVTSGSDVTGVVSRQIVPQAGATTWGRLRFETSLPADTWARVSVRGWNGSDFVALPGLTNLTAVDTDLRGLRVADWPRLRLVAETGKNVPTAGDPSVLTWSMTSVKPVSTVGAQLTCGNCHGSHTVRIGGTTAWDFARASDPNDTKAAATDATSFCLGCHDGSLPAPDAAGTVRVPNAVYASRQLPGGATVWWNKAASGAEFTQSGHYLSASGRTDCATCHDPHGSNNPRLLAWTRPSWFADGLAGIRDNVSTAAYEENLCFQCHGNGVVGGSAPGAQDVATPAGQSAAHPVASPGRHASGEPTASLGIADRHSECVDCHDPHAAQPGTHVPGTSTPAPALRGAWGVTPTWLGGPWTTATSYAYTRFTGQERARESYLCFKCHTTYVNLPETTRTAGIGGTDLAVEFNPGNPSYHNVLGLAKGVRTTFKVGLENYTWAWAGTSLKAGWGPDSAMTCTDCHTGGTMDQAKGPHGSSVSHILDPSYPSDWRTAIFDEASPTGVFPEDILCAKCHTDLTNTNSAHGAHRWLGGTTLAHQDGCVSCHIAIPHGWKRPRMLVYASDPAPYMVYEGTINNGSHILRGVELVNQSPQGWGQYDCVGCSSGTFPHGNGLPGGVWP